MPPHKKVEAKTFRWDKAKLYKKTASEKESLTRSRSINDQEPRCVMEDSLSEVENSVNDVTSLLKEEGKVPDKTIQKEQLLKEQQI